jgi:hypothetical protein
MDYDSISENPILSKKSELFIKEGVFSAFPKISIIADKLISKRPFWDGVQNESNKLLAEKIEIYQIKIYQLDYTLKSKNYMLWIISKSKGMSDSIISFNNPITDMAESIAEEAQNLFRRGKFYRAFKKACIAKEMFQEKEDIKLLKIKTGNAVRLVIKTIAAVFLALLAFFLSARPDLFSLVEKNIFVCLYSIIISLVFSGIELWSLYKINEINLDITDICIFIFKRSIAFLIISIYLTFISSFFLRDLLAPPVFIGILCSAPAVLSLFLKRNSFAGKTFGDQSFFSRLLMLMLILLILIGLTPLCRSNFLKSQYNEMLNKMPFFKAQFVSSSAPCPAKIQTEKNNHIDELPPQTFCDTRHEISTRKDSINTMPQDNHQDIPAPVSIACKNNSIPERTKQGAATQSVLQQHVEPQKCNPLPQVNPARSTLNTVEINFSKHSINGFISSELTDSFSAGLGYESNLIRNNGSK